MNYGTHNRLMAIAEAGAGFEVDGVARFVVRDKTSLTGWAIVTLVPETGEYYDWQGRRHTSMESRVASSATQTG